MKEKSKNFVIKVIRFNPDEKKSYTEEHEVPYDSNLTVLNALHYINSEKRAGISHRFSCGMGICGSCGAIVNGKPTLMCSTFCKDLKQPIVIAPLNNFPILKDLVVDTDKAMSKFRDAMPYTNITAPKENAQKKLFPKDMEKFKQQNNCIKCMLCYSACPVYGQNNDFMGPAAIATADRYNKDKRDTLKNERLNTLTSKNGIYNCTAMGECSIVCPKNVDPTKSIQKMKVSGVTHALKSIIKK